MIFRLKVVPFTSQSNIEILHRVPLMYRRIHENGSVYVVSAVCYTIYIIYCLYPSLCTQTAETTSSGSYQRISLYNKFRRKYPYIFLSPISEALTSIDSSTVQYVHSLGNVSFNSNRNLNIDLSTRLILSFTIYKGFQNFFIKHVSSISEKKKRTCFFHSLRFKVSFLYFCK